MGSVTKTEQTNVVKKRQSNRIEIRNVPTSVSQQTVEDLIKGSGTVKRIQHVTSESEPYYIIILDTPDEAQMVEITNNNPASGKLTNHVRPGRNPGNVSSQGGNFIGGGVGGGGGCAGSQRQPRNGGGCPLRILVPSDFVGAIIGRKGQTIKSITQKCKARVDVHGKEAGGALDKINDKVVISIYGQPENCTNACKEIMHVLQQESNINEKGEISLKMLANDRFCGRIIGKDGKMIKKIKEETDTKIAVSNAQEMACLYPDRVIAIRGSIEGMAKAEAAISAKLAECIEQEQVQNFYPFTSFLQPPLMPMQQHQQQQQQLPSHMGRFINHGGPAPELVQSEVLQISVPNTAVGALIGTGGVTIKQMMKDSRAFINIESKKEVDSTPDRIVIIKGTPDSCWRAAFMVFERMKMEGFAGHEEVRLKTTITVPRQLVGRLIGKSGKNVRELQRFTGAMIKLPDDANMQGDQVAVDVVGHYLATRVKKVNFIL
ncbi:hypothetical protein HELRODRAFT_181785 [Helobdella robusta]|uniref:K Homology domain-containing protein n=1 Tax=Helobdella robusta TaxID=6412 RepID=T1FHB6_HELRO|nr:hypothetical protein HELRODRAFT_181785 [Helobdella robusta]ESN92161.1 hypothetical protein HELRODRAFT_181785 [Helobdella robusta]